MSLKNLIDPKKIPKHIAIIMDGNGRWAKQYNKPRIFGHHNAIKAVRDTVEGAIELGIKFLTLYTFSIENWNRPKREINALMQLLNSALEKETKTLIENDIRLLAIGNLTNLPENCYKKLIETVNKTANNKRMSLILAISYGARWEIVNSAKIIAQKIKNNEISSEKINEELFIKYLTTADIPDPELLIRSGGEYRLSNFLLWQIAYTELYFTEKLWPDFRRDDLYQAIIDYQRRERRFGKISEQLEG